jgi:hypothetical protein
VESLLSTSPDSNNGEDREKIVAEEIEDRSNTNLTITKTCFCLQFLPQQFFLCLRHCWNLGWWRAGFPHGQYNTNLTITKTINRLGTVFFLFVFNIGISIFVFLLTNNFFSVFAIVGIWAGGEQAFHTVNTDTFNV